MSEGDVGTCAQSVARDGFCFAPGQAVHRWISARGALQGWEAFAESWKHLGDDPYLAAHGRQRRRCYGVWHAAKDGALYRQGHQPHFQSLAYNALQGDMERWFDPISRGVAESGPLEAILTFALDFFAPLKPHAEGWHVEVHQFRIEPAADTPGEPTPEGVHRDGVDFVLVLMIARHNIARGTTSIHAPDGATLGSFTLAEPLDAALLDDARVYHGVTPVLALDPLLHAYRDVLVVTLRAA